jgi:hypothetical protein
MNFEHRQDMARADWVKRFEQEWSRVSGEPIDPEYPFVCARTLHPIMGHRAPEEAAREYFLATDETGAWEANPERLLRKMAVRHGLVSESGVMPQELLDFAFGVGELCAFIGDGYRDPKAGCAGDAIRARYGRVPF